MTATIEIQKRDFSKNPRMLRRDDIIPATVYGNIKEPMSIQLNAKAFKTAFKNDKTSLLELKDGSTSYEVLVKNVQIRPINQEDILNVEFYKIDAKTTVKVEVPVALTGESPAVKARGKLITPISKITVECLPKDIPHTINVDLSQLKEYGNTITVGDINYGEGVKPVSSVDNIVAKVNAPKGA